MIAPYFRIRDKTTRALVGQRFGFATAAEANNGIHPDNVQYFEVVKVEMKEVLTLMKPEQQTVWVEAK